MCTTCYRVGAANAVSVLTPVDEKTKVSLGAANRACVAANVVASLRSFNLTRLREDDMHVTGDKTNKKYDSVEQDLQQRHYAAIENGYK
jgi:hypothetical protein